MTSSKPYTDIFLVPVVPTVCTLSSHGSIRCLYHMYSLFIFSYLFIYLFFHLFVNKKFIYQFINLLFHKFINLLIH